MKAEDQSAEREALLLVEEYLDARVRDTGGYGETVVLPAVRAALSAREAPAREGWQPIETAPKDGTTIILESKGWIVAGYWAGDGGGPSLNTADADYPWLFLDHSSGGLNAFSANRPTRWMPLPERRLAASPQAPTIDPAPPAAKAVEMDAQDTKRLDWLDQQRDLLFDCYMQDGKVTHIIRQHWGQPLGHGPTPRAAIDAAMGGNHG